MVVDTTGEQEIRAEAISKVVKGFALQSYRIKGICMQQSSKSWTETYFKETAADLTGHATTPVKGIPRLANFPYGEVSWEKVSAVNIKHGMEGIISWEDEHTSNIPVIARTLLRIARAVAKSVDTVIAAAVLASAGNTQAANATWDNAVIADRDPIQDILNAQSLVTIDNYDIYTGGSILIHPADFAHLLGNSNVRNAGQFFTDDVTRNGKVGRLLSMNVINTNSVTEGGSQIVIGKEALTWKSVVGLTVKTIPDPGIKKTIRAWEVGQIQVPNPNAICKITGV